jgi:ketosteroid isomerase-like protein
MTAAAPASTTSVANELVSLCRAGRNLDAIAKLYSPKIVSIEPVGSETMPAEMAGIEAIRRKNETWFDNYEVNSAEVNGPFVGGDQFAVQYVFDTTFKQTGQRSVMTEMALYTVKDGKIAREQFFYNAPEPEA